MRTRGFIAGAAVLALGACGGSSKVTATDTAWCKVNLGETRSQIEKTMGKASLIGDDKSFANWTAGPVLFSASFKPDGTSWSLQINNDGSFPCATLRRSP